MFPIRGKFARISVKVDLDKPLIAKIRIWGRMFQVEYEGLHQVCFRCGKYRHRLENCLANQPRVNVERDKEAEMPPSGPSPVAVKLELVESFGPWMIAQSRPRRKKSDDLDRLSTNSKDQQTSVIV